MGIIRSGAILFIGSLLFISLFAGNIFLSLSWSLEYDNVEAEVLNLTSGIGGIGDFKTLKDAISDNHNLMIVYCEQSGNDTFEYNMGDFLISTSCESIKEGPDAIFESVVKNFIRDLYYKNYECGFIECIKNNNMFVILSKKSYDYWNSKFKLMMISSVVLFSLLFFLHSRKSSAFITGGILTIISALPFMRLDWLISFVPSEEIKNVAMIFFSKAYSVFYIMSIIGVVLFVIGIGFSFLRIGIHISNIISKIMPKSNNTDKDDGGKPKAVEKTNSKNDKIEGKKPEEEK